MGLKVNINHSSPDPKLWPEFGRGLNPCSKKRTCAALAARSHVRHVSLYNIPRRGDAAVVGTQDVRNGVISIQTEKTGMQVTILILSEIQATLAGTAHARWTGVKAVPQCLAVKGCRYQRANPGVL